MSATRPSAIRSAVLFGITLNELLLFLLVIVLLIWGLTDNDLREQVDIREGEVNRLKAEVEALKAEVNRLNAENREQERENKELRTWINTLLHSLGKRTLRPGEPLPPIDVVVPPKPGSTGAETNAQGLGARGFDNCLGKGPLFNVIIKNEGLEFSPAWSEQSEGYALIIEPARELGKRGLVGVGEFISYGEQILAWSEGQQKKCRFDVRWRDESTEKAPYEKARKAIERVFYDTEVKEFTPIAR